MPCVVRARTATTDLVAGASSSWTGRTGRSADPWLRRPACEPAAPVVLRSEVTATKIYVNLAMPDLGAEKVAAQDVDGVGLLRAEFILTEALGGRHPRPDRPRRG